MAYSKGWHSVTRYAPILIGLQSVDCINELVPVANDEIITYFKTNRNIIHILNMRFIEINFRVTTVLEIHEQAVRDIIDKSFV